MAFSSLQNGMATNSTTKWLFPAYKMVWHKLDSTKWCSFVSTLDLFFQQKNDIFIQKLSNNCIHTPRKTPGHFVELPPCPELSSKGNFQEPFCRVFTLSLVLFQFHPKLIKNASQFCTWPNRNFFFPNNMLTF